MKQTIYDPKKSVKVQDDDRRGCRRVCLSYPIRVAGSDRLSLPFSDLTVTTDVSEQGCRFDLLRELELGDVLIIQIVERGTGKPHDDKTPQFKVAWVSPSQRGWSVGVVMLTPENIWHMAFPRRENQGKP